MDGMILSSLSDGTRSWVQDQGSTSATWGSINGLLTDQTDLSTELSNKVNNSRVLTDVPAGAVFTDTVYDDTAILARVTQNETNLVGVHKNVEEVICSTTTTLRDFFATENLSGRHIKFILVPGIQHEIDLTITTSPNWNGGGLTIKDSLLMFYSQNYNIGQGQIKITYTSTANYFWCENDQGLYFDSIDITLNGGKSAELNLFSKNNIRIRWSNINSLTTNETAKIYTQGGLIETNDSTFTSSYFSLYDMSKLHFTGTTTLNSGNLKLPFLEMYNNSYMNVAGGLILNCGAQTNIIAMNEFSKMDYTGGGSITFNNPPTTNSVFLQSGAVFDSINASWGLAPITTKTNVPEGVIADNYGTLFLILSTTQSIYNRLSDFQAPGANQKMIATKEYVDSVVIPGIGGTTASRPKTPALYTQYWDTTINKLVIFTGTGLGGDVWKDALGAIS